MLQRIARNTLKISYTRPRIFSLSFSLPVLSVCQLSMNIYLPLTLIFIYIKLYLNILFYLYIYIYI